MDIDEFEQHQIIMELKLSSELLIERLRHSGLSRIYGKFIFKNHKVEASAARLQSQSTSNSVGVNKVSSNYSQVRRFNMLPNSFLV